MVLRFRCRECGAEKDAAVRRVSATLIKCVCGGDALSIGVPDGKMVKAWWTRDDGESAGTPAKEWYDAAL